jgi:AraC family transcriptional regulator
MSQLNPAAQLGNGTYLGKNEKSFRADGVIISETVYVEPVYEGWHAHENSHISFILAGGNREQRRGGELEALPGNALYYRSGEQHRNLDTRHPSKNINLEISAPFFSQYGLHAHSFDLLPERNGATTLTLLKIYEECRRSHNSSIASIHSLLLSVFETKAKASCLPPVWFNTVKQVLHDRWNETVSLTELSQAAGVHPVTISKLFPHYFHCSLGEYLRRLKLEKALLLLRQGNRSLTDIAHYCGFFDQSHFTRTFKQATGFLPKTFQKL